MTTCMVGESTLVHLYRPEHHETACGQGGRFGGPVRQVTGRALTCERCMAWLRTAGRDLPPAA